MASSARYSANTERRVKVLFCKSEDCGQKAKWNCDEKVDEFTSETEAKFDPVPLCDHLMFAYPICIVSRFQCWLPCIQKR